MTDALALIRTCGALLLVLGMLVAALWATRRFNIVLPGTVFAHADKRLAIVERLALDPRRSLALFRYDGVEHLLLLAPEGHLMIETRTGPVGSPATQASPPATPALRLAELNTDEDGLTSGSFGSLVERARRVFHAPPMPGSVRDGRVSRLHRAKHHA